MRKSSLLKDKPEEPVVGRQKAMSRLNHRRYNETALQIICATGRSLSGEGLSDGVNERVISAKTHAAAERCDLLFGDDGNDAADPIRIIARTERNPAENAAAVGGDAVNSGDAVNFGGVENFRIIFRPDQGIIKTSLPSAAETSTAFCLSHPVLS